MALAKARHSSLQGAGATACLRVRPIDSLRVIPAAELVGFGRRFMGIEEDVAVRCPCCDVVDVDTRHARICPRAGTQVNQHRSLLHEISPTLKRLLPQSRGAGELTPAASPRDLAHVEAARNPTPSGESDESFTEDRNLRMNIVIRRKDLRDAPIQEYREKSIRWQTGICGWTSW